MDYTDEIYIASVLLEPNRHKPPKLPSFELSSWLKCFKEDGFDGVEIWENHALKCSEKEKIALINSTDLAIFGSYCGFDPDAADSREAAAEFVKAAGINRIKYNVGKNPGSWKEYRTTLLAWAESLPADVRLLCECHPGTIIEEPEAAKEFFSGLPSEKFGIIVHPLRRDAMLEKWMALFGSQVCHVHLQLRNSGGMVLPLSSDPVFLAERINLMKRYNFKGSFSLEFTEGMNQEGETVEDNYRRSLADLAVLKSVLYG